MLLLLSSPSSPPSAWAAAATVAVCPCRAGGRRPPASTCQVRGPIARGEGVYASRRGQSREERGYMPAEGDNRARRGGICQQPEPIFPMRGYILTTDQSDTRRA
eukprot:7163012-Pyramimonas_sp.AAC.2